MIADYEQEFKFNVGKFGFFTKTPTLNRFMDSEIIWQNHSYSIYFFIDEICLRYSSIYGGGLSMKEEDLDEIEKILFPKRDKPTSTEPEEKPKQKKIKL